jgi:hypothetical protein
MILSMTMGVILAVIAGIVLAALLYYLVRSMKGSQKAGGWIGVSIGLIGAIFLIMSAGRIVVVTSPDDAGSYLVYGSPTYEFSNGYELNLTMESMEGYVINDSKLELVLEKIIYSTGYIMNDDYDILIKPMSITKMPGMSVDYYFNDLPPDEIELSQGTDSETRYHLRTRDSYEDQYGITVYSTATKSISAQSHSTASESED